MYFRLIDIFKFVGCECTNSYTFFKMQLSLFNFIERNLSQQLHIIATEKIYKKKIFLFFDCFKSAY